MTLITRTFLRCNGCGREVPVNDVVGDYPKGWKRWKVNHMFRDYCPSCMSLTLDKIMADLDEASVID